MYTSDVAWAHLYHPIVYALPCLSCLNIKVSRNIPHSKIKLDLNNLVVFSSDRSRTM